MAGRDGADLETEEGEYSPEFGSRLCGPFWSGESRPLPIDAVVEILEEG